MKNKTGLPLDTPITVCDKCFCSSCWQGLFLCDYSLNAGTVEKTVRELIELDRENQDYFSRKFLEERGVITGVCNG